MKVAFENRLFEKTEGMAGEQAQAFRHTCFRRGASKNILRAYIRLEVRLVSRADEFYQVRASDGEVIGAVQGRKYNAHAKDILGFECSISVDDVDETVRRVEEAGGKTLMTKTAIPGVGWIAKFMDTEGNLFAAIHYDKGAT